MKNIMDYGKAQGMSLVGKYLPQINPFRSIVLVQTLDEWEQVKDQYSQSTIHRVDYPLGKSQAKRDATEGTNGFAESVPELIATVQQQGEDGAVLLARTFTPSPPRYLYLGGFNILFYLEREIKIELVGRAFDGNELTQGLACHERFCLDWDDTPFINSRADLYRRKAFRYLVSPEEYQAQREARIKFLVKGCHYPPDAVERNVPELLVWVDDLAIRKLFDDVVICLQGQKLALRSRGLTIFGVQGNIIMNDRQIQIQPWEIFAPKRWS